MRRLALGVLAAILLCNALAAVEGRAADPQTTTVMTYRPYTPNGHTDGKLWIEHRLSGDCWTSSLATARADAWRCMAGNTIYDPCFSARATSKEVVCPTAVFAHTAVVLKLKKPFPKGGGGGDAVTRMLRLADGAPWLMRLSDGKVCVFVSGATFAINDRRANYICDKDWWVVGTPVEKSAHLWVASLAKGEGAKSLRIVPVATAVL